MPTELAKVNSTMLAIMAAPAIIPAINLTPDFSLEAALTASSSCVFLPSRYFLIFSNSG